MKYRSVILLQLHGKPRSVEASHSGDREPDARDAGRAAGEVVATVGAQSDENRSIVARREDIRLACSLS